MERSDAIIKFVAVFVFIAIMCYLGLSFLSSYRDPLRTVTAAGMELHDGLETSGYIVRDEQLLTASGDNVAVTVTEGAKLASGETVAVRYSGSAAMERAQQISEIQLKIRQLTALKNGKSEDELSEETILSLARAVTGGDLSGLYEIEQDVDAYIIYRTALATGQEAEEIAALEEELRQLSQSASSDTGRVTAPFSGTFSFAADGLESVTPGDVRELTVAQFKNLFSQPREVDANVVGRLIRGTRWYYATQMDEVSARKLTIGKNARLAFSRTYSQELTMLVESISPPEDGVCAVVFSSDKYMQDVAALRGATAEIVFGTLSGISVPREAVHVVTDGEEIENVVYVLQGISAVAVPVNIIAENGDYYMVEEARDGLRVGDIIIVRAKELYSGAVVEG